MDCDAFRKLMEAMTMDVDNLKVKFGFQKCPKCLYLVQKSDGCNYMTCRCQCKFCYLCGAGLDGTNSGNHWVGNSFALKCKGISDCVFKDKKP
jgi:hypothetical protein